MLVFKVCKGLVVVLRRGEGVLEYQNQLFLIAKITYHIIFEAGVI